MAKHVAEFEALIRRGLNKWDYPIHPLRHKHLKNVKEAYLNELLKHCSSDTFELGRMELFQREEEGEFLLCGLRKLNWDTNFFGFPVGRIEILTHSFGTNITEKAIQAATNILGSVLRFARQNQLKHIIAMADPSDVISINALERVGFLLKDTMFYHLFDLEKISLNLDQKNVRLGNANDLEDLMQVTLQCFNSREAIANRFYADPQYPAEKVNEMYKIWLMKSLTGERADRVFVVDYDGKPAGYLTAILPSQEHINLNISFGDQGVGCVSPNFQGKGIFALLHQGVLSWFKELNIKYALTRTAINTLGVNKVCSRHGSVIACSPHTFHLNLNGHHTENI